MKKLKFILIGTLTLFIVSSCLQNEEPASIENLRNARAELYQADAAYKMAEIAYLDAQRAFQQALTDAKLLDNKLKEIDIQLGQIDVECAELEKEMLAAQVEYEKKMLELDLALQEQQNAYEIEKIKAEIKGLEVELLDLENQKLQKALDKQRLEQQKQLEQLNFEIMLKEKEKELAEAEAAYEEALKEIEENSHGLTEAQMEKIYNYRRAIEYIRDAIKDANAELIDANNKLIKAKYNFHEETAKFTYENDIVEAQRELDYAIKVRDEAQSIDFNGGQEALMAKKTELENNIKQADADIDNAKTRAKEKEFEKTAYEEEITKIDTEIDKLESKVDSINKLIADVGTELNVRETYTFDVDPAIQNSIAYSTVAAGYRDLYTEGYPADNDMIINNKFVWDYATGRRKLENDQLSWTSNKFISYNLLNWLNYNLSDYFIYSNQELLNLQNDIAVKEANYEATTKKDYDKAMEEWKEAKTQLDEKNAEYGIIGGKYVAGNTLLDKAIKALEVFKEWKEKTDKTEAEKLPKYKECARTIYKEQNVRQSLGNMAIGNYKDLNPDDASWETAWNNLDITIDDYENAVNNSMYNSLEDYSYFSGAEKSIHEKIQDASLSLYGLNGDKTVTVDFDGTLGDILWNRMITNDKTDFSAGIICRLLDNNDDPEFEYMEIVKNLYAFGYQLSKSSPAENIEYLFIYYKDMYGYTIEIQNSLWGKYNYQKHELAYEKEMVANQEKYVGLYNAVQTELDKLMELVNEFDVKTLAYHEEIRDLRKQQNDLGIQRDEQVAKIDLIDEEINAISVTEVNQIESLKAKYEGLKTVVEGILGKTELIIDGVHFTYDPSNEAMIEKWNEFLIDLDDYVNIARNDLKEAKENLDEFMTEEADKQQYAIDKAQNEVTYWQGVYDDLMKDFEYLSRLLKDYMENVIGDKAK